MSLQPLRDVEHCHKPDHCNCTGSSTWRFSFLFFCSVGGYGSYYFYDQLSAIQEDMIRQNIITQESFGLLSSIYSIPGTLSPFFAGFIMKGLGSRTSLMAFAFAILVGSGLFTLGIFTKSVPLLFISRFVFGLGGESQYVVLATLLTRRFLGKESSFALAINLAMGRLGSVGAFVSQPSLIKQYSLVGASCVCTGICFCAFLFLLIVVCLDKRMEHRNVVASDGQPLEDSRANNDIHIKEVLQLPKMFWILALCCAIVQIPAFPFFSVTSVQYLTGPHFDLSKTIADDITSVPEVATAILGPALGRLIDCLGQRHLLIVMSSLGMVLSDAAFLIYPTCVGCLSIYAVYVALGISLSLFAAVIWPSIPLTVDEDRVGTAFGVATALQNLGMAVSPFMLNWLYIRTNGCTGPFVFLLIVGSVGFILSLWILQLDRKQGNRLARP